MRNLKQPGQVQNMVDYAVDYARHGFAVFPVHYILESGNCSCGNEQCNSKGKHPFYKGGFKEASKDEFTIRRLWKKTLFANIGIATGSISNLFVIDIDKKNGGFDSLDIYEKEHGKLDDRNLVVTGSGGFHYYYLYSGPECRSTINIRPGIDTRGDGGYVIAPPSNSSYGSEYFFDTESGEFEGGLTVPPSAFMRLLGQKKQLPAAPAEAVLLPDDEVKRIRAALVYVPADDRDTWLSIGMALQATNAGNQAFGLWCEWAMQSDKFDMGDSRRVWASFKPGGGVGLGSLFATAKSFGWVAPAVSRPPEPPIEAYAEDVADASVVDADITPVSRSSFEAELTAAGGDVDAVIRIATTLQLAPLHQVEIDLLLKQAAKQIGVSVSSLKSKPSKSAEAAPQNDAPDYVDELNEKHAIVPVGGRVMVMNREYDPALEREMYTYSNKDDFILRYSNRPAWVSGDLSNVAKAWLLHKDRRQYEGVVFAPNKDVDGYLNLFTGFPVTPSESGSCDLFVDFMRDVICSGDSELFIYMWSWLAHLFQRPDELPGTSFVLRGKQGVGKNTLVDTLGILVGAAHYIQLSSVQQVTGRFSGHLANVLLVFANEAIWGGDKTAEGALKHMVTDAITSIEGKGRDIIAMNNYKRLIAASNEDWIIPRGLDDRRFIVVDVSDKHKEDYAYFKPIRQELENGGYEALMGELMSFDISSFNPRDVPERLKQNGWELKIRSGGSILQWWFTVLDNGYLFAESSNYADEPDYVWPTSTKKTEVHKLYLKYCEQHKITHPEMDSVMGRRLKEWGVGSSRSRINGRIPHYEFPALADCRAEFAELAGIPADYWADTD